MTINKLLSDNVAVPTVHQSNFVTAIISVSVIGDGTVYITGSVGYCELTDNKFNFESSISLDDAFGFVQAYDTVNVSNVELRYLDESYVKDGPFHIKEICMKSIDTQKQEAILSLKLIK